MRIIFYNRAGVFFVSARLPCLPACVPACLPACLRACGLACLLGLAWPGPGLLAGLAAWLQRMHSAEARGRHTISMHTCCLWHATALFVSKHKKSTVESAQSLLIV